MARLLTLHDPREARAYYEAGVWQCETLYDLLSRWASERAQAVAVRDALRSLTWASLKSEVDNVASSLLEAGVCIGDRVSVWMDSPVEAVVVFLACSRNGHVFNTSLHHTYTVNEVVTLLERVSCRAFFGQARHGADGDRADIFDRVAALPTLRAMFAVPPQQGSAVLHPRARWYPRSSTVPRPLPQQDPDRIVYLAFTSGTTGAPKGVMHSNNTLLANARAMVEDWGHGPTTVLVSLSQLSHHIGTVALCQALVGGFELILSATGGDAVELIERTGATYVMGVPTQAIDILNRLSSRGRTRLGRVSTFYLAGAPIPTKTASDLLAMGIKPQNVYGMTENGSHQYTLPSDDVATITATCGRACRAYEVKLFSQANPDAEVAPGEVGQIGGRGAMRMLGYFANQSATEEALNADGWLMSGDLGRIDQNGNLHIVGRIKDVIIRGGHNIHPAGIEDLAMKHTNVAKAAVVGVPDERLGERVCLVVTPRGQIPPTGADLLAHLHSQGLSKFDMPEYFAVIDSMPLGPTGKILKRELAALLHSGSLSPQPVKWRRPAEDALS